LAPDRAVYRRSNASPYGIADRNPDGSTDTGYDRQASRLRRRIIATVTSGSRSIRRLPDRAIPAPTPQPERKISMNSFLKSGCLIAAVILHVSAANAEAPDAIAARGETHVATLHAHGAQVYECKADAAGKLAWQFREPIATLFEDGKTVGRHYAGPNWELADGSAIMGKVVARAPGATDKDIPLLKLEVTSRRGTGRLAEVTTIQRINTKGGVAEGPCPKAGAFLSVPYAADYAFYRKSRQSLAPSNMRADVRGPR